MTTTSKPLYSRFLDLPEENVAWDSALCCFIQAPLENTTSYRHGTAAAPQAILRASQEVELYDPSNDSDLSDLAVCVSAAPKLTGLPTKEALPLIESLVDKALNTHKWPLVIGGEQTVSYAAIRSLLKLHPDLHLVQLDAHFDLKDIYRGSNFSHRCIGRRVLELGVRVLHLGARSYSRDEAEFALASSSRFSSLKIEDVTKTPAKFGAALAKIQSPVYLSVDMSVLDPSECPGVSNPEPSGLSWNELMEIVGAVFAKTRVVGADIVETSPIEGDARSELLAAKLATKLFSLHQTGTTP